MGPHEETDPLKHHEGVDLMKDYAHVIQKRHSQVNNLVKETTINGRLSSKYHLESLKNVEQRQYRSSPVLFTQS